MTLEECGMIPHHCTTVAIGDTFERLTILAIGKKPGSYRYQAICQCVCGSPRKVIRLDGIISGAVISCGCVQKERSSSHSLTSHPLYGTWRKMIERCENPENKSYPNYGGRGITVCERWHQVENFVSDMQDSYSPGLTIERVDNNQGYFPDNCTWATKAEQADNRRTGHKVTFNGKTQSILKWSKELNLNYGTLWTRIAIWGWSPEKALTTPPLSKDQRMEIARNVRWGLSK